MAASHADHTAQLRLDAALQLLGRSGISLPTQGDPNDPRWLQQVIDGLIEVSSRDVLTGLANRRQFELALEREADRVARAGEPALLLLLDLDHFKSINDTHGHAAGDLVLQAVAQALLDCVRPMDTVARYGGEEFAVILPNCPPTFGSTVAERVRRRIESRPIAISASIALNVTASVGGAFAPPWVRSSSSLWTERADRQLYQAKAAGRNRTCLESPATTEVSAEEKGMLFGLSSAMPFDDAPKFFTQP